ncbi:MAG: PD40 domain-containing protein [Spirochaetaceae bacterium]|nr:PD40 domain-containing protein [Spirochaetaceae bacterium]
MRHRAEAAGWMARSARRARSARSARSKGRAGLLVGLALLAAGCVSTKLTPKDLPEEPIAFLYWEEREGGKRKEIFEKAAELPPRPPDVEDEERMQEIEIRAHVRGEISPILQQKLAKYPGRLTLLWPHTGRLETVEAAPPDAIPLAWSKDRLRLLFASAHRGGKLQLYEYHLARKDLRPLTTGPAEHARGDYAPGGGLVVQRIRRSSPVGAARQSVHLASETGRIGRAIGRDVPPGTLRISPQGDRIVYEQVLVRPREDGPTVYESMIAVRSLESGSREELIGKGREPTWTPDGEWIVFASESASGYRLRRMRPDGTTRVPIGPGTSDERMPSVSPDGAYVAFIDAGNGRRRLAVRSFDGKRERVLVTKGWSELPVW